MPIKIIRADITKVKADAIVNAANSSLLGGGGVDGAIHRAAGPRLLMECMKLGGCKTGQAKLTRAYNLPAKYVIHTVGPKWKGGLSSEQSLLESCYREALRIAVDHQCESIAFPLISSGVYGYPKDQAPKVAIDTITAFLIEHEMLVYIVVFDKSAFQISEKLFADITSFIDDKYVDTRFKFARPSSRADGESTVLAETRILQGLDDDLLSVFPKEESSATRPADQAAAVPPKAQPAAARPEARPVAPSASKQMLSASLEEMVKQIDESFSQMLLRKIDEIGMTDAECYKKANVDRKLFSKIRSDVNYRPSKTTAIAFAIALELDLVEAKDMLMKAGFALSHSNKFDTIIEYFITNKNYNIFEINEALFAFDQSLLGV